MVSIFYRRHWFLSAGDRSENPGVYIPLLSCAIPQPRGLYPKSNEAEYFSWHKMSEHCTVFPGIYRSHGHWEGPGEEKLGQGQAPFSKLSNKMSVQNFCIFAQDQRQWVRSPICLTFEAKRRNIPSISGEVVWSNVCSMQYLKLKRSCPVIDCYFLCIIPDPPKSPQLSLHPVPSPRSFPAPGH